LLAYISTSHKTLGNQPLVSVALGPVAGHRLTTDQVRQGGGRQLTALSFTPFPATAFLPGLWRVDPVEADIGI